MRGVLLVAAMLGSVSAAQAADMPDLMPLRGGFTDGLSASRTNWQGYYVGGQADWGTMTSKISPVINADMQATFTTPGPTYSWHQLPTATGTATGFGAFAGYNGQWDDVVLGIEANYSHFGLKAAASSTGTTFNNANQIIATTASSAIVNVSDFGSLRARAGYAWGCFLPYVFFGGGVGSQTLERAVSAQPAPVFSATTSSSRTKLVYGYSAGLGVDVMLWGGLFVRGEYEFQRVTSSIESNINTVRAGVGYKF